MEWGQCKRKKKKQTVEVSREILFVNKDESQARKTS